MESASFSEALLFDVFTAVSDEARAKSNKFSKQGGLKSFQGLTYGTPTQIFFAFLVRDLDRRLMEKILFWPVEWELPYFQQFSKRPIPFDVERPVHDLDYLMKTNLTEMLK